MSLAISQTVCVNCPVHKNIYLQDYQQQIVATPHFQRLHRLKQLGSAYAVYPSATHTRFSHCLGVGHLAGKMFDSITQQQPELCPHLCAMDRKLVVAAGMMHDLGHGPHSHAFEYWAHEAHCGLGFDHEKMSIAMIRDASERGMLPFLDELDEDCRIKPCSCALRSNKESEGAYSLTDDSREDRKGDQENDDVSSTPKKKRKRKHADSVKTEGDTKRDEMTGAVHTDAANSASSVDNKTATCSHFESVQVRRERRLQVLEHLIVGGVPMSQVRCLKPENRWMLDIVHNSLHGIDVDKMDYLLRDTQTVFGAPPASINLDRIITMARVLGGRICFHRKVAHNLYQLLQLRLNMHQQVYGHKACISVELMLRDVLGELDCVLDIGDRLESAEKYMLLDDTLFQTARYLHQQTMWLPPSLLEGGVRRDHAVTRRLRIELALARALTILDDIDARRLYMYVTSATVDGRTYRKRGGSNGVPSAHEVYQMLSRELSRKLQSDDILVETRCFNYGKGDANPMTAPMFFEWNDTKPQRVKPREITHILPKQFSEYKVWLFCKRRDLDAQDLQSLRDSFERSMYPLTPSPPTADQEESLSVVLPEKVESETTAVMDLDSVSASEKNLSDESVRIETLDDCRETSVAASPQQTEMQK